MIEAAGNRPVIFIGISRSGALAVNFAAMYPNLVEKLVLVGTRPFPEFMMPPGRTRMDQVAQDSDEAFMQALRQFVALAYSEPGCEELIDDLVFKRSDESREAIEKFFTADPQRDLRSVLPTLHVPTLILHGAEDRLMPVECAHYLAEHIRNAQLSIFAGQHRITHQRLM